MLEGRGAVLETAARVSRILKDAGIDGAVIGGIAVVLHGHVRTTCDVDVLVRGPVDRCRALFEEVGLDDGVPIHLFSEDMVQPSPGRLTEVEGITTLRLSDLISIKLHSGMSNLVRAQDIADVIGLIRAHSLGPGFARYLDRSVRAEFKKLARAVQKG